MYDTLKQQINDTIKANGKRQITGTNLNQVLNAIVSELGEEGASLGGFVTPSQEISESEGNIFYIASEAGTYTNFDDIVVGANEIAFLYKANGEWTKASVPTYVKPSNGIPSTDLDSSVQTSLGKADTALQQEDIAEIESVIPAEADKDNKLADKNYVDTNISTASATFRGTSAADLTEQQFIAWANALTKDNNDYVFWNTVDSDGDEIYKRYKWNGTQWSYEFTLSNTDKAILYKEQNLTDNQRLTALANVSNQTANSTTGKMGYKVLDPTKTFVEQVTAENTIYEIRDVFDLNGGSMTIPANCTLKFEGGKLENGKIVSANTTMLNSIKLKDIYIENIIKGYITDDMIETPSDYDVNGDWLVLNNLLNFESAEIISRKKLFIKSWVNPYISKYNLSYEELRTNQLNIDGNGATIVIQVDNEAPNDTADIDGTETPVVNLNYEAIAGCKKHYARTDGGNFIWGVPLKNNFIRVMSTNPIVNLRNVNIVSDKAKYEYGGDLTVTSYYFILPGETTAKRKSIRGYFIVFDLINDSGNNIVLSDIKYIAREGFVYATASNSNISSLRDSVTLSNCNISTCDGFILELWRASNRFPLYETLQCNNCTFNSMQYQSIMLSNAGVRNSIFENCTFISASISCYAFEMFNCCQFENDTVIGEPHTYVMKNCVLYNISPVGSSNTNSYTAKIKYDNCIFNTTATELTSSNETFSVLDNGAEINYVGCTFGKIKSSLRYRFASKETSSITFDNCLLPDNFYNYVETGQTIKLANKLQVIKCLGNGKSKYKELAFSVFPKAKNSTIDIIDSVGTNNPYAKKAKFNAISSSLNHLQSLFIPASLQDTTGLTIDDGMLIGVTAQKSISFTNEINIYKNFSCHVIADAPESFETSSRITLFKGQFTNTNGLNTEYIQVEIYAGTDSKCYIAFRINTDKATDHNFVVYTTGIVSSKHDYCFTNISPYSYNKENEFVIMIDGSPVSTTRVGAGGDFDTYKTIYDNFKPNNITLFVNAQNAAKIESVALQSFSNMS